MLDYLQIQGSTENPTLLATVFTMLLAFLLSSLMAFTYEKTTEDVTRPVRFLQSLILVSMVAAMVMLAIGDSLARGLGMLGAMAIIRFRTNLKTTRNTVFIFASLAVGIACGVYGFVIAMVGTICFCMVAVVLYFSPMSVQSDLVGTLKFDLPLTSNEIEKIEQIMRHFCRKFKKVRHRIGVSKNKKEELKADTTAAEKVISFEYLIALDEKSVLMDMDAAFTKLQTIQSLIIDFEINPENI